MSKHGRLVVVMALVALAVAGCGGKDEKSNRAKAYTAPASTASDFQSTADPERQDAEAKANARSLATEVEACFVDEQTYDACQKPPGTKLPLGSGPGQVEVSKARAATYTIVAHSKSGTNFQIEKDEGGAVTRTCDLDGEGGCQAGGTW